jgi:hypothetical protein
MLLLFFLCAICRIMVWHWFVELINFGIDILLRHEIQHHYDFTCCNKHSMNDISHDMNHTPLTRHETDPARDRPGHLTTYCVSRKKTNPAVSWSRTAVLGSLKSSSELLKLSLSLSPARSRAPDDHS